MKQRCIRCNGLKFMYKVGGGYSRINMGGEKVKCPLCRGEGETPLIKDYVKRVKDDMKNASQKNRRVSKQKEKEKETNSSDLHASS